MSSLVIDKIEYFIMLVAEFASGMYFQSSGYVYSFLKDELYKNS